MVVLNYTRQHLSLCELKLDNLEQGSAYLRTHKIHSLLDKKNSTAKYSIWCKCNITNIHNPEQCQQKYFMIFDNLVEELALLA